MPTASLRALAAGDLDEVLAIERATFPDPWSRRDFEAALANPRMLNLAAEAGGRVVGYGMAQAAADEGEILNLAVAADARGRGSGRLLLAELLARLREAGAVRAFLEVRRCNDAAIALYRAAGFVPLGVRRAYYDRPREDALTMSLELGSPSARKG